MKSERISPFWVNGYQPFSASQSKRMAERCHCQASILSGKRFRQRYPGTASGCLEVEEVQRKSN